MRSDTTATIHSDITACMRYRGQGWEIPVPLPDRAFAADDAPMIRDDFRAAYARLFGRAIEGLDGMEIEIVTLSVRAQDQRPLPERQAIALGKRWVQAETHRPVFDPATGATLKTTIVTRDSLAAGDCIRGPAVITERETSTVVTSPFDCVMQADGSLLLIRRVA